MKDQFMNEPLKSEEIDVSSKPFYKNKLFLISISVLFLIILIIIIILISSSNSYSNKINTYLFTESTDNIINPDQGFYNPVIVYLNPDSFKNQTNYPEQVYHLRCDISQFSGKVNNENIDKNLTDFILNALDEYLFKIKSENKNVVIRFSYDPAYKGNKNKEPSMNIIEEHIKQLGKIMNKHIDTLIAIEAGMLGPWGEMHSSEIATEENKALVFKYWLENTKEIPILARTPKAIFTYFNKTLDEMENFNIEPSNLAYRLGLFNDGYLGTNTDYGTYTYNRSREVNWLSKQNKHLPYGGETNAVSVMSNLEICIPEMYLLSLSYLNIEYNSDVIEKWKNLQYNSTLGNDSLYYGMSGFDYINKHLGYRFVIESMNGEYNIASEFKINLNIKNVGFGNLLKTKKIDIVFTNFNNTILKVENNVANFKGDFQLNISGKLLEKKSEKYKMFIRIYGSIENNVIYYPLQFANKNIYDNKLKAHYLFTVENGEIKT